MATRKRQATPSWMPLDRVGRLFRKPVFCVVSSIVVATIVSFLLTDLRGIPVPIEHDEYSYLLGADTFASMRICNPTHPMWDHFETFHVIHQPNYATKYPPAQSLTLATGQLLGHPIIGASLATGISIGALVWMLIGWLPRKFYWVIWLFAVFHPALQLVWGQSYWGGAVAVTGSSLLLGAFIRLTKKMEIRYSLLAATGVILLANSRPFEGAVLTAVVLLTLVWKLATVPGWNLKPFLLRVIFPATLLLACGSSLMLTYNYQVTGNALIPPYQVHESEYGWNPLFLWQSAGTAPAYRHTDLLRFHLQDKQKIEETFGTIGGIVANKSRVALGLIRFFWGGAAIVALIGLPFLLRQPRYRLAFAFCIPPFMAALVTPWAHFQYCAPASPLLMLLFVGGLTTLWIRTRYRPILRVAILVVVPVLHLISIATIYVVTLNKQQLSWANQRAETVQVLSNRPGKDLVLVRYSDDHDPHQEWVYNEADIDAAEVVWARESPISKPAARDRLLEYFSDRHVWLIEPDSPNPHPQPISDGRTPVISGTQDDAVQ